LLFDSSGFYSKDKLNPAPVCNFTVLPGKILSIFYDQLKSFFKQPIWCRAKMRKHANG